VWLVLSTPLSLFFFPPLPTDRPSAITREPYSFSFSFNPPLFLAMPFFFQFSLPSLLCDIRRSMGPCWMLYIPSKRCYCGNIFLCPPPCSHPLLIPWPSLTPFPLRPCRYWEPFQTLFSNSMGPSPNDFGMGAFDFSRSTVFFFPLSPLPVVRNLVARQSALLVVAQSLPQESVSILHRFRLFFLPPLFVTERCISS